jgi:Zn-dependent M32 family carboxypeptidase
MKLDVINKNYTFEDLPSLWNDISEAINAVQIPTDKDGVFLGSFELNLIYTEEKS